MRLIMIHNELFFNNKQIVCFNKFKMIFKLTKSQYYKEKIYVQVFNLSTVCDEIYEWKSNNEHTRK